MITVKGFKLHKTNLNEFHTVHQYGKHCPFFSRHVLKNGYHPEAVGGKCQKQAGHDSSRAVQTIRTLTATPLRRCFLNGVAAMSDMLKLVCGAPTLEGLIEHLGVFGKWPSSRMTATLSMKRGPSGVKSAVFYSQARRSVTKYHSAVARP